MSKVKKKAFLIRFNPIKQASDPSIHPSTYRFSVATAIVIVVIVPCFYSSVHSLTLDIHLRYSINIYIRNVM